MAIVYVWFPLRPDGSISAAERIGLLTGLRHAATNALWTNNNKHTGNFSNATKHTANSTNATKHTGSWTNNPRH